MQNQQSYIKVFIATSVLIIVITTVKANDFNIVNYGAKGDGKTINTKAINDAIDAASKVGGGTVYFPAGIFLSFSIHLQNNIHLYLDAGCVLMAADSTIAGSWQFDEAEPNAFDKYQDFGHSHWHNSLIWGENLSNISITGFGIIDGTKGLVRFTPRRKGLGNKAIALKLCKGVILRDFTILNGGHFGILATGVDNFTIDNLKMDTNRDGMDIDCCKNVRISNCSINAPWDDAICLKSSYALGYNTSTDNVTITNCQVSGYDLGTFYKGTYEKKLGKNVPDKMGPTGRIKLGTESNGGFKNISISNCVFDFCRGLALETVDGAVLEDIVINNITMRDVVNSPIFIRLGARNRGPEGTTAGTVKRVSINNINAYNADAHFACLISGIPNHNIEDVKLSNINIMYRAIDSPQTKIQTDIPEYEKDYPEPARFGVVNAYGFFIRHVNGIQLNNITTKFSGEETRPAIVLDDVSNADLFKMQLQKSTADKLVMKHINNITIQLCEGLKNNAIRQKENISFK